MELKLSALECQRLKLPADAMKTLLLCDCKFCEQNKGLPFISVTSPNNPKRSRIVLIQEEKTKR